MRYEKLKIDLISVTDVVATSSEVTTEGVKMPWQPNTGSSYEGAFDLLSFNTKEENFDL